MLLGDFNAVCSGVPISQIMPGGGPLSKLWIPCAYISLNLPPLWRGKIPPKHTPIGGMTPLKWEETIPLLVGHHPKEAKFGPLLSGYPKLLKSRPLITGYPPKLAKIGPLLAGYHPKFGPK